MPFYVISDPFPKKRNVARSVSHSHVFEYIYDRMRAAFHYYGVPHTKKGPVFTDISPSKLEDKLHRDLSKLHEGAVTPQPKPSPTEEKTVVTQVESDVVVEDIESDNSDSKPEDNSTENNVTNSHKDSVAETPVIEESVQINGNLSEKEQTEKFVERLVNEILRKSIEEIRNQMAQTTDSVDNNHSEKTENNVESLGALMKDMNLENGKVESETNEEKEVAESTDDEETDSSDEDEDSENEKDLDNTEKEDEDDLDSSGVYSEDIVAQLKEEDIVFKFDATTLADGKVSALNGIMSLFYSIYMTAPTSTIHNICECHS